MKGKDFKGRDSSKGKGKPATGAGAGGTRKDQVCHYCHKTGHLRAECRKRLKDEQGKSGANAVEDTAGKAAADPAKAAGIHHLESEWVLAVGAEPVDESTEQWVNELCEDEEEIMVDSGCARSVCPQSFAGDPAPSVGRFTFTTASGKPMKHHGSTTVLFDVQDRHMKLTRTSHVRCSASPRRWTQAKRWSSRRAVATSRTGWRQRRHPRTLAAEAMPSTYAGGGQ